MQTQSEPRFVEVQKSLGRRKKGVEIAMERSTALVLGADSPKKRKMVIQIAGAHSGAKQGLPPIGGFAKKSTAVSLVLQYIDPIPGRAAERRDEARQMGIESTATEAKFEDVLREEKPEPDTANIIHIDTPSSIDAALSATRSPTLLYWIWRTPQERLWGVRAVLGPHDPGALARTSALVRRMVDVAERNGSEMIFGAGGIPSHVIREPRIRGWFGDHMNANLAKVIAGIEPSSVATEVTDGFQTYPMVILIRDVWSNPVELAEQAIAESTSTLRRGTQFVVAEVTPEGIRLHIVRIRLDGKWTTGGVETIDRAAANEQWEEYQRRLKTAMDRAERETLSRRNPVMTTD